MRFDVVPRDKVPETDGLAEIRSSVMIPAYRSRRNRYNSTLRGR